MSLQISGLRVELDALTLVEDFTFRVEPGRVHAVVGESGSGKTLSAFAALNLLPDGATVSATIVSPGRLAMILQEPLSALNPVLTIGAQLLETLEVHGAGGEAEALALLKEVGLESSTETLRRYPHQLSGGQRQRVCIACALAAKPAVLIADEPTTALDASLRRVILTLLRHLAVERQMGVWLITHDLLSVRDASDEVTVMYAGRVVEHGPTAQILSAPRHPYTRALVALTPKLDGGPLQSIPGAVPLASEVISGCRFHPRCSRAEARCRVERPVLVNDVACLLENGR